MDTLNEQVEAEAFARWWERHVRAQVVLGVGDTFESRTVAQDAWRARAYSDAAMGARLEAMTNRVRELEAEVVLLQKERAMERILITYGTGDSRILATCGTDGIWIVSTGSSDKWHAATSYVPGTGMALLFDAHLKMQQELAEFYSLVGGPRK